MSSICPPHNDIEQLLKVQRILSRIPEDEQHPDYVRIVGLVNDYIYKRCNHYIVTDSIDIDPDRSQTIYYCNYCYRSFPAPK
jgi:hypothetical protein